MIKKNKIDLCFNVFSFVCSVLMILFLVLNVPIGFYIVAVLGLISLILRKVINKKFKKGGESD